MGARILVIEDNPANLELMVYLLRALGHDTIGAVDGCDALARVRHAIPDLVICDLQLPQMDGYEVARRMKVDPKLAGVPIIAVTAFAMPGDRERALAAGFNGYLSKPIAPERFMQQIGQFLAPPRPREGETGWRGPYSDHQPRAVLLVIEDHPASRRRIQRTLERRDLRFFLASNMDDAAELRHRQEIDLVLVGADLDPEQIAALDGLDPDQILWPIPLNGDDLIAQIESSLAERMRVT